MGELREHISRELSAGHPLGVLRDPTAKQISDLPYGQAEKEIQKRIEKVFDERYIWRQEVIDKLGVSAHHLNNIRENMDVPEFFEGRKLYFDRDKITTAVAEYKEASSAE